MSPKRKTIPKTARAVALTRHFVKSLRKEDGSTHLRKTRSGGGEEVGNSWVQCTSCHRTQPPTAYVCDEHAYLWVCGGCCGGPHDDEQTEDQIPTQDDNEEEDGER